MTRRIAGRAAAAGVALGPAWRYEPGDGSLDTARASADPAPTIDAAMRAAAAALGDLAALLADQGRDEEAAILEAQALIATDPALLEAAERGEAGGSAAAAAVRAAGTGIAARIEAGHDPGVAARGADVRDVADRVGRILEGAAPRAPEQPSILVADDLPPSTIVEMPASLVLGIATESGSPVAHAAILAKSRGIPMVVGATGLLAALDAVAAAAAEPGASDPAWVLVDGDVGTVTIAGSEGGLGSGGGTTGHLAGGTGSPTSSEGQARARARATPILSTGRGSTADGHRVRLVANIDAAADADRAIAAGAEGVGLFRTEALFLGRGAPPPEREQRDAYRRVFAAFGRDRPVAIRLADIGGDKSVAYLPAPAEANPFLGVRGIRLARRERGLFLAQLRAIAQAAADAGVESRVLAPMVATRADVELLVDLRDEAVATLTGAGAAPATMRLGAMIETPSAALMVDVLARGLDFLSIGTNDLTQYTLAADRGNPALARLQDALHPAVLRLIRISVDGAAATRTPLAVCGEAAGDPAAALVLVGLGIAELSMEAGSLALVRTALATVDLAALRALAETALHAPDAAAVRALVADLWMRVRPVG